MGKIEKMFIRIIPICLMIIFIIIPNIGFAGWFTDKVNTVSNGGTIDTNITNTTSDIMSTGEKIANTIGKGLATIMLIVIGIKYLLASPEGKADYKKYLVPYLIGVVFVYMAGDIITWFDGGISEVGNQLDNKANETMNIGINVVSIIGKGIALIMLVVIGIKYMSGSPEGKAEYRKTLTPYIAGAILVYLASDIVKWFEGGSISNVGNNIEDKSRLIMIIGYNVANIIGTSMATIMLLVLGIKYMSSSPEGKADYRKTAIPYLVGAIIVFAATKIIGWISATNFGNANSQVVGVTTGVMGTILTATEYIGFGIAMLMILVLAIKYMTASPEAKAEISKTSTAYIVGAVVLFSASAILGIIQSIAGQM